MAGLYIHIPFCLSKCPYCDFYSLTQLDKRDAYTAAVLRSLGEWRERTDIQCDTLYIGGGTPSVMGGALLKRIIDSAKQLFLTESAEITVECNPSSVDEKLMFSLAESGVNRISMGLQSAVDSERKALGRLSGAAAAEKAVKLAQQNGISNISLDLMLGVPGQTEKSLDESLDFCVGSGVKHISAYMLKIEENTHFYEIADTLDIADEDEMCVLYLQTVERLNKACFAQYEISNFSLPGFESRHNLNYWDDGEYLGIGPAAHSFLSGRRFYYKKSVDSFIEGCNTVDDGTGGDFEEYAMLRLRLSDGLTNELTMARFGFAVPDEMYKKAKTFSKQGLVVADKNGVRLTPNGFLLSNTIIADLLF